MTPLYRMGAALRRAHAVWRRVPPWRGRYWPPRAFGRPGPRTCVQCGARQIDWICATCAKMED